MKIISLSICSFRMSHRSQVVTSHLTYIMYILSDTSSTCSLMPSLIYMIIERMSMNIISIEKQRVIILELLVHSSISCGKHYSIWYIPKKYLNIIIQTSHLMILLKMNKRVKKKWHLQWTCRTHCKKQVLRKIMDKTR